MIVVTGAAGFIGSCLVSQLNNLGHRDLILVDEFTDPSKMANLEGKQFREMIPRDTFFTWAATHGQDLSAIFHIGARTDTAEQDWHLFLPLNVAYSQQMCTLATAHQIPLLYASSAATYGDGSLGFSDDPALIPSLSPLNPYGHSKQVMDQWVLKQSATPPKWVGLKFFNVYGPNEYHKGRMASVIFHAFPQVRDNGLLRLFRSHRSDYSDGGQLRDFIYVRDVVEVMTYWLENTIESGIYNLGTGQARTFLDLAAPVFDALGKPLQIDFIDIPQDIREAYQYYTEANMSRFYAAGFIHSFRRVEVGTEEYVREYLITNRYF